MFAYVDASVIITFVEDEGIYKQRIESQLIQLHQFGWEFLTSKAVWLEVMCKPFREKDYILLKVYDEFFMTIPITPTYTNLFDDALYYMQIENLKVMDSIHVALAKLYGCEGFITTDPDFQNLQTIQPLWIDLATA